MLQKAGPPFIDSVSRLIALLLDYGSVSGDAHKAQRMGCMLNLLVCHSRQFRVASANHWWLFPQNFYREIDKEELYVRYIYKLAELHVGDQSYTEAGFTLLLHARALEVGSTALVCCGGACGHYHSTAGWIGVGGACVFLHCVFLHAVW